MRHPLLAWIDDHHPRAAESLCEPASEDAIAAARLPEALAALYREHDGQTDGPMESCFLDDGFHWLPLADGHEQKAMVTKVVDDVRREFPEAEPFAASWFPIGGDHLGNLLVVDVDADEVFPWFHDEGRIADGEAPSSAAFLDDHLERLVSGALVVDPKIGVVDPTVPPIAHAPRAAPPPPRWALPAILLGVLAFVGFVIWLEATR